MTSLGERILELNFAVDSFLRGKVTERGLVGAGSRAGFGLGGKNPSKVRQSGSSGSSCCRSCRCHYYIYRAATNYQVGFVSATELRTFASFAVVGWRDVAIEAGTSQR